MVNLIGSIKNWLGRKTTSEEKMPLENMKDKRVWQPGPVGKEAGMVIQEAKETETSLEKSGQEPETVATEEVIVSPDGSKEEDIDVGKALETAISKQKRTALNVIEEIYLTEKNFLDDMGKLVVVLGELSENKVFSKEERKKLGEELKAHYAEILKYSDIFIRRGETLEEEIDILCEVFLTGDFANLLKVLESITLDYNPYLKFIEKISENTKKDKTIQDTVSKYTGDLRIGNQLGKPFQRAMRYDLLVGELSKQVGKIVIAVEKDLKIKEKNLQDLKRKEKSKTRKEEVKGLKQEIEKLNSEKNKYNELFQKIVSMHKNIKFMTDEINEVKRKREIKVEALIRPFLNVGGSFVTAIAEQMVIFGISPQTLEDHATEINFILVDPTSKKLKEQLSKILGMRISQEKAEELKQSLLKETLLINQRIADLFSGVELVSPYPEKTRALMSVIGEGRTKDFTDELNRTILEENEERAKKRIRYLLVADKLKHKGLLAFEENASIRLEGAMSAILEENNRLRGILKAGNPIDSRADQRKQAEEKIRELSSFFSTIDAGMSLDEIIAQYDELVSQLSTLENIKSEMNDYRRLLPLIEKDKKRLFERQNVLSLQVMALEEKIQSVKQVRDLGMELNKITEFTRIIPVIPETPLDEIISKNLQEIEQKPTELGKTEGYFQFINTLEEKRTELSEKITLAQKYQAFLGSLENWPVRDLQAKLANVIQEGSTQIEDINRETQILLDLMRERSPVIYEQSKLISEDALKAAFNQTNQLIERSNHLMKAMQDKINQGEMDDVFKNTEELMTDLGSWKEDFSDKKKKIDQLSELRRQVNLWSEIKKKFPTEIQEDWETLQEKMAKQSNGLNEGMLKIEKAMTSIEGKRREVVKNSLNKFNDRGMERTRILQEAESITDRYRKTLDNNLLISEKWSQIIGQAQDEALKENLDRLIQHLQEKIFPALDAYVKTLETFLDSSTVELVKQVFEFGHELSEKERQKVTNFPRLNVLLIAYQWRQEQRGLLDVLEYQSTQLDKIKPVVIPKSLQELEGGVAIYPDLKPETDDPFELKFRQAIQLIATGKHDISLLDPFFEPKGRLYLMFSPEAFTQFRRIRTKMIELGAKENRALSEDDMFYNVLLVSDQITRNDEALIIAAKENPLYLNAVSDLSGYLDSFSGENRAKEKARIREIEKSQIEATAEALYVRSREVFLGLTIEKDESGNFISPLLGSSKERSECKEGMVEYSGRLTDFVASQVVSQENVQARVRIFERWVEVAKQSKEKGDILSCVSIIAGLTGRGEIARLYRTRNRVSSEIWRELEKLKEDFVGPEGKPTKEALFYVERELGFNAILSVDLFEMQKFEKGDELEGEAKEEAKKEARQQIDFIYKTQESVRKKAVSPLSEMANNILSYFNSVQLDDKQRLSMSHKYEPEGEIQAKEKLLNSWIGAFSAFRNKTLEGLVLREVKTQIDQIIGKIEIGRIEEVQNKIREINERLADNLDPIKTKELKSLLNELFEGSGIKIDDEKAYQWKQQMLYGMIENPTLRNIIKESLDREKKELKAKKGGRTQTVIAELNEFLEKEDLSVPELFDFLKDNFGVEIKDPTLTSDLVNLVEKKAPKKVSPERVEAKSPERKAEEDEIIRLWGNLEKRWGEIKGIGAKVDRARKNALEMWTPDKMPKEKLINWKEAALAWRDSAILLEQFVIENRKIMQEMQDFLDKTKELSGEDNVHRMIVETQKRLELFQKNDVIAVRQYERAEQLTKVAAEEVQRRTEEGEKTIVGPSGDVVIEAVARPKDKEEKVDEEKLVEVKTEEKIEIKRKFDEIQKNLLDSIRSGKPDFQLLFDFIWTAEGKLYLSEDSYQRTRELLNSIVEQKPSVPTGDQRDKLLLRLIIHLSELNRKVEQQYDDYIRSQGEDKKDIFVQFIRENFGDRLHVFEKAGKKLVDMDLVNIHTGKILEFTAEERTHQAWISSNLIKKLSAYIEGGEPEDFDDISEKWRSYLESHKNDEALLKQRVVLISNTFSEYQRIRTIPMDIFRTIINAGEDLDVLPVSLEYIGSLLKKPFEIEEYDPQNTKKFQASRQKIQEEFSLFQEKMIQQIQGIAPTERKRDFSSIINKLKGWLNKVREFFREKKPKTSTAIMAFKGKFKLSIPRKEKEREEEIELSEMKETVPPEPTIPVVEIVSKGQEEEEDIVEAVREELIPTQEPLREKTDFERSVEDYLSRDQEQTSPLFSYDSYRPKVEQGEFTGFSVDTKEEMKKKIRNISFSLPENEYEITLESLEVDRGDVFFKLAKMIQGVGQGGLDISQLSEEDKEEAKGQIEGAEGLENFKLVDKSVKETESIVPGM